MNWILVCCLLIGASWALPATSAPASTNEKAEITKADGTSNSDSQLDDAISGDTKSKRSQEVIMFGNQQNKPAGMVDDGLVRYAEKKSQKRQDDGLEDEHLDEDEQQTELGDDGRHHIESEELPLPAKLSTTNSSDLEENDNENKNVEEVPSNDEFSSKITENDQDSDLRSVSSYLPKSQYDEVEESEKLSAGPNYLPQEWNNYYGNRFYNDEVYRRKRSNVVSGDRRSFSKRSLMTPLDELMNAPHGARWKRDVKFQKDDIVELLGILAAAEAAKERQASRKQSLSDLESGYLQSVAEAQPTESEDFSAIGDNINYLPIRYEGQDDDLNDEDVPEWAFMRPQSRLSIRRRSLPFYPPIDYRSLGVIGARKRSNSRRPEMWGQIDQQRQFLPRDFDEEELPEENNDDLYMGRGGGDGDDNEDDNEDERDEELYSLGELLNGNDMEDTRYPVYRRLI